MEFKGTQGEWKSVTLEATDFYLKRSEIHYGDDGECVAEYIGCPIDAQLIAAAPDLLAALEVFVNFPKEDLTGWIEEGRPINITVSSDDIKNAVNAINKALGL